MSRPLLVLVAVLLCGCVRTQAEVSCSSFRDPPRAQSTVVDPTTIPAIPPGHDVIEYLARFQVEDERELQEITERLEGYVQRPWTVERLAAAYASEMNSGRRAALVYLLAASRDPMGLRVAGNALDDKDANVVISAAEGIELYWMDVQVGGGTEQVLDAVGSWWQDRGAAMKEERGR